MNNQQVKVYISLHETNSFQKTSNELGYSVQNIYKVISQLESEFCTKLVNRQNGYVKFTEIGEIVYHNFCQLKDVYHDIINICQNEKIIFGMDADYYSSENEEIISIIQSINKKSNNIFFNYEYRYHEHYSLLDDGKIDAFFSYYDNNFNHLFLPIRKCSFYVISNQQYFSKNEVIELSDLNGCNIFCPNPNRSKYKILFDKLISNNIKFTITQETSPSMVKQKILRGQGVTIIHDEYLDLFKYSFKISKINIPDTIKYGIYYSDKEEVKSLINTLKKVI